LIKIHDDIEKNITLDSKAKKKQKEQLQKCVRQKYNDIAEKYPSALRAQMLSSISSNLLLH
jgi:hypothetical protein